MKSKSRPTFTIIENPNYNDKYEVYYDDYKREYLDNSKTLDEVDKQFKDIPNCVLDKWGKRIRKEKNIFRRNTCRPLTREMQYIQKLAGGRYQISKVLKGRETLNCGVYPSLEICKTARDIIWLSNFDESVIEAVKEEYGEDNYIHPSKAYALSRYDEFEEMYEKGFNAYPSVKDVKAKIDTTKMTRIYIDNKCVNLIKEMENYQWRRDKDGNILDEPIKKDDHAVDGLCYNCYGVRGKLSKFKPASTFDMNEVFIF